MNFIESMQCCRQDLLFKSRDRDRDLDKMNSSALESGDHGLEITTLNTPHCSTSLNTTVACAAAASAVTMEGLNSAAEFCPWGE